MMSVAITMLAAAVGCAREGRSRLAVETGVMTGGGVAERGPDLIRWYGCGSCHFIPGVVGAQAPVGPPLDQLWRRGSLGGTLPNTAQDLVSWIEHPQRHHPGTLMPEMNVTLGDARDMAAYLYTLR